MSAPSLSAPSPASASLPTEWTAILDRIDARLQEAIAAADQRAQAPRSAEPEVSGSERGELDRLATNLQVIVDADARARVIAAEADAALVAADAALRQFRGDLESLRRRLDATAGRAIG